MVNRVMLIKDEESCCFQTIRKSNAPNMKTLAEIRTDERFNFCIISGLDIEYIHSDVVLVCLMIIFLLIDKCIN